MNYIVKNFKWIIGLAVILPILIYVVFLRDPYSENDFIGKWKSSKLETPLYLYANGEWEIKTNDGNILQYGVWEYKDRKIIWSYRVGGEIGHDPNAVLSANEEIFQVYEKNGTVTTFYRLD